MEKSFLRENAPTSKNDFPVAASSHYNSDDIRKRKTIENNFNTSEKLGNLMREKRKVVTKEMKNSSNAFIEKQSSRPLFRSAFKRIDDREVMTYRPKTASHMKTNQYLNRTIGCTDICCVPVPIIPNVPLRERTHFRSFQAVRSLSPSPSSDRSSETGSIDSVGSAPNSCKSLPQRMPVIKKYQICERKCCYSEESCYPPYCLRLTPESKAKLEDTYGSEQRSSQGLLRVAQYDTHGTHGTMVLRQEDEYYQDRRTSRQSKFLDEIFEPENGFADDKNEPVKRIKNKLVVTRKSPCRKPFYTKGDTNVLSTVVHTKSPDHRFGSFKQTSSSTCGSKSRAVANLLERRRVAELNVAFEKLRSLVPCYGDEDRPLSKIKILKYALHYTNHLMQVLTLQAKYGYFDASQDFKLLLQSDSSFTKTKEQMSQRMLFGKLLEPKVPSCKGC